MWHLVTHLGTRRELTTVRLYVTCVSLKWSSRHGRIDSLLQSTFRAQTPSLLSVKDMAQGTQEDCVDHERDAWYSITRTAESQKCILDTIAVRYSGVADASTLLTPELGWS